MSDLTTRALDRAARAEDSPGARGHALAVRLRSAPMCGACDGCGAMRRDDDVTPCRRCAGTGSPLRARVELAAHCGSPVARAALGGPLPVTARRWSRALRRSARGVEVALSLGMASRGPCLLCGCGLDALHRTVDAVRERFGREPAETIARDLGLTLSQVYGLCGRQAVQA